MAKGVGAVLERRLVDLLPTVSHFDLFKIEWWVQATREAQARSDAVAVLTDALMENLESLANAIYGADRSKGPG